MAQQRPTASEHPQSRLPRAHHSTIQDTLTRAEARALSRSTPLTPSEFRAKRDVAEQLVDPLPMLLDTARREGAQDDGRL